MTLVDQEDAGLMRKHQYEKSEAIERRLDATDHKLKAVSDRMDDAGTVISDIRRWRERLIEMQMLTVFMASSAGAAADVLVVAIDDDRLVGEGFALALSSCILRIDR